MFFAAPLPATLPQRVSQSPYCREYASDVSQKRLGGGGGGTKKKERSALYEKRTLPTKKFCVRYISRKMFQKREIDRLTKLVFLSSIFSCNRKVWIFCFSIISYFRQLNAKLRYHFAFNETTLLSLSSIFFQSLVTFLCVKQQPQYEG